MLIKLSMQWDITQIQLLDTNSYLKTKQKLNLPLPNNYNIKNILTNIIDLSGSITKAMLTKLQKYIGDEVQYTKITEIFENKEKFTNSKRKDITS